MLGVARELIELGVSIGGFEMKVAGTLPPRSGLASSAALEVATALFLLKLQERTLQPMEIANLCRRAEQRSAGVQSGLLDQVTSLCGRANHLIYFDSRAESIQLIPFPSDLAFIVAQSGKQRELSQGDYNFRREQTAAAAHALGVRALREVSSRALKKRADLDPLLSRRARHVFDLRQLSVSKVLHKPMPIQLANDEVSHRDGEVWVACDRLLVPTGRLVKSFWPK